MRRWITMPEVTLRWNLDQRPPLSVLRADAEPRRYTVGQRGFTQRPPTGRRSVVQRLAHVSAPPEVSTGWRKALYLFRQPLWLLGLLFLVGTFVFTATALYFGQIALVQPVLLVELIFMLALRRFWLRDQIAVR